jgi:hypothetical protein
MKKMNFTFLKGFAISMLMAFGVANANAQGLACQDHINASLDISCSVDLTTTVLGAGGTSIRILDGNNVKYSGSGAGINRTTHGLTIGATYMYELINGANKCWGTIKFEDKLAPQIDCPANISVACDRTYGFSSSEIEIVDAASAGAGQITRAAYQALYSPALVLPIIRECSAFKLFYSDSKSLVCAPGSVGTVTRTFRVTDAYGNTQTCTQVLTLTGYGTNNAPLINAPADLVFSVCKADINLNDYTPEKLRVWAKATVTPPSSSIADITANAYPTGVGATSNDCMLSGTYTDKVTDDACGKKIVRTWVVVNMCTGVIITNPADAIQIITLTDNLAPVFAATTLADLTITTGAANCLSAQSVPFPSVTDNCCIASATLSIGGINFSAPIANCRPGSISIVGLPVNSYQAVWRATDACGNVATRTQTIVVRDLVAPIAVADQNTNVSLTLDCTATVNATTFDDGSLDNCCLDVNRFEVARMDELTGLTPGTTAYESKFRPTVTFVKGDLSKTDGSNNPNDLKAGCKGSVMVVFRVWDCNGNNNTAMVNVVVEDKIGPLAQGKDTMEMCGNTALGTQWLEGWEKRFSALSTLQYPPVFGTNPGYFDNCSATVTWGAISGSIDQCSNGTMTRVATVKDGCDRTATATFTYNSGHQAEFTVTLPANNRFNCPGSSVPTKEQAIADARRSITVINGCPVVAVDIKSEEIFSAVAGACYRIKRTWVVSSLCHNGMLKGDWKTTPKPGTRSTGEDVAVMGNSQPYIYDSRLDGDVANGKRNPDDDKYVEYVQVIDVNDTQKPEITNPQTPVLAGEGKCGLKLTVGGFDATDACAPVTAKTWSLLDANKVAIAPAVGGSTFPATYTFSTADYGKKFYVRYRAEDRCGNIDIRDYLVEPKDIIKPTPVCYQGLSIDLMPTTREAWISATMFDAGSSDGCKVDATKATILPAVANPAPATNARQFSADNTVELRLEIATGTPPAFGTGVPATNMVWVNCVGIVPVRLWAIDAAGNADYCDTYVDVQNNMGAQNVANCPSVNATGTKVAGAITASNGTAISNAVVTVNSSTAANSLTAKVTNGLFSTPAIIALGSNVKISADKNDNPLNGVSTVDLVLMSKHILGTQTISDKFNLIAADVNNNGKVTTSDVVELRKMILGIQNNFNNNKSWRFFDAQMNEEVTIQNIQKDANVNFTAVKVGDINGNANATSAPRTTYTFVADDKNASAGELVTLTLDGTEGFGFTMNYDAKALEVVSVDENSAVIENGTITTAQVGSTFKVTFKANTNVTLSEAIAINSNVTTAEAVVNGEATNVALKFNNKVAGFELFQNQPNPFRGATMISFNAANAGDFTITVTDVAGRTVKTVAGAAVKGLNNVTVEMNNAGVYNYTVTTGNFTATKKMVVIE